MKQGCPETPQSRASADRQAAHQADSGGHELPTFDERFLTSYVLERGDADEVATVLEPLQGALELNCTFEYFCVLHVWSLGKYLL